MDSQRGHCLSNGYRPEGKEKKLGSLQRLLFHKQSSRLLLSSRRLSLTHVVGPCFGPPTQQKRERRDSLNPSPFLFIDFLFLVCKMTNLASCPNYRLYQLSTRYQSQIQKSQRQQTVPFFSHKEGRPLSKQGLSSEIVYSYGHKND